jgi:hypothetical protein
MGRASLASELPLEAETYLIGTFRSGGIFLAYPDAG